MSSEGLPADTGGPSQGGCEEPRRLYGVLVDGFREVSGILDERKSTLAADPVLAELAARVAAAPDVESDEVKRALLYALDSRELSGAGPPRSSSTSRTGSGGPGCAMRWNSAISNA